MKKALLILFLAAICGTATAQDVIVRTDRQQIDGKVLRVGGSKIEYTLQGDNKGPVYTISTDEVNFVRYADGREVKYGPMPTKSKRQLALDMDSYPHYQGEVAVGYSLGLKKGVQADRVGFETVHGVRLSPYAFIGAGAGLNYFYQKEELPAELAALGYQPDNDSGMVAAFANAKGYYPVSAGTSIYLSLDLGASIGVWGGLKNYRDLYTAAGPGVSIGSPRNRLRFDGSVRFQYMGTGSNAIMLRIGLGF